MVPLVGANVLRLNVALGGQVLGIDSNCVWWQDVVWGEKNECGYLAQREGHTCVTTPKRTLWVVEREEYTATTQDPDPTTE